MRLGMRGSRGVGLPGLVLMGVLVGGFAVDLQGQAPAGTEVSLRLQGGRLIVPVEAPDGEILDFMVTNGQAVTLLAQSLVDRLGSSPALTLGGVEIPTGESIVVADDRFQEDGVSFQGIVGANTLNQFDVLFDVPGGRLVLQPVQGTVQWPGVALSDPVAIQVYHGVALAMNADVNGTSYRASLDLGRKSTVVNQGLAKAEGLDGEGAVHLRFAGADRSNHPVDVRELDIFQRWSPDGSPFLLLGIPLVADCPVSISWAHQEIRTCSP